MRRQVLGACLIAAASAVAQQDAPSGFLRGELVSWQGAPGTGQLAFRVSPDLTYTCFYDERTYVERDNQRITMDRLGRGDRLEIVTDRKPGSSLCYTRAIQAVDVLPRVPGLNKHPPASPSLTEALWRISWFTLSGAVSDITPARLILRLRTGEHRLIWLRPETRYIYDGQTADQDALAANTVVFIRATRDLRGDPEASQVIWGDILRPE